MRVLLGRAYHLDLDLTREIAKTYAEHSAIFNFAKVRNL
jgi:hypothetical protein